MTMRPPHRLIVIVAGLIFLSCSSPAAEGRLRIATLNVWSGLTYEGITTIRSWESDDHREARIQSLIRALYDAAPDLVLLQEVNPACGLGDRLADALSYDVICQRVLGGMKIGPVGIPTNLNEGLVILARRELALRLVDVLPLSGGFGAIGNGVSFHFAEQNIALVARIDLPTGPAYVVNVHLPAFLPNDEHVVAELRSLVQRQDLSSTDEAGLMQLLKDGAIVRHAMIQRLLGSLASTYNDAPIILGGDLNATPGSTEVQSVIDAGFIDAVRAGGADTAATWDPAHNENIRLQFKGAPSSPESALDLWYDGIPRRIDHLFFSSSAAQRLTFSASRFADTPSEGVFPSDHAGVLVDTDITLMPIAGSVERPVVSATEFLPILSYDTDVGFGYGVKTFFLSHLGWRESFDVTLFNSTKGERWYRVVFSVPDFELRQGTVYPWALDVILDYDKYLKNSFFGVGGGSRFKDREYYTREPFELQAAVSRGLSKQTVAQAALKYRVIRHFNFTDTSHLRLLPSPSNGRASAVSVLTSLRRDTRDSYINPSRGSVLQAELEYAPLIAGTTTAFTRGGGWAQYYATLFYPKTILACRVGVQTLSGSGIPVQFLLPIGGNATLRGSPQDRFLDRASIVTNIEFRFPVWWRFGGVMGWDAGRVWSGVRKAGFSGWRSNSVAGIRLYMDTFIVRADLGFGSETTGFYLNFGQLF